MNIFKLLGLLFVFIASLIAVHQFIGWGYWFELEDLHHETWMIMFGFAGVLLLGFFGRR